MEHVFSAESPEEAYPGELLAGLTESDGVAVAEIAGRDSVAAAVADAWTRESYSDYVAVVGGVLS
jgi:hypothetical protein